MKKYVPETIYFLLGNTKGSFNNHVDKMRGEGVSQMSMIFHVRGEGVFEMSTWTKYAHCSKSFLNFAEFSDIKNMFN